MKIGRQVKINIYTTEKARKKRTVTTCARVKQTKDGVKGETIEPNHLVQSNFLFSPEKVETKRKKKTSKLLCSFAVIVLLLCVLILSMINGGYWPTRSSIQEK